MPKQRLLDEFPALLEYLKVIQTNPVPVLTESYIKIVELSIYQLQEKERVYIDLQRGVPESLSGRINILKLVNEQLVEAYELAKAVVEQASAGSGAPAAKGHVSRAAAEEQASSAAAGGGGAAAPAPGVRTVGSAHSLFGSGGCLVQPSAAAASVDANTKVIALAQNLVKRFNENFPKSVARAALQWVKKEGSGAMKVGESSKDVVRSSRRKVIGSMMLIAMYLYKQRKSHKSMRPVALRNQVAYFIENKGGERTGRDTAWEAMLGEVPFSEITRAAGSDYRGIVSDEICRALLTGNDCPQLVKKFVDATHIQFVSETLSAKLGAVAP